MLRKSGSTEVSSRDAWRPRLEIHQGTKNDEDWPTLVPPKPLVSVQMFEMVDEKMGSNPGKTDGQMVHQCSLQRPSDFSTRYQL